MSESKSVQVSIDILRSTKVVLISYLIEKTKEEDWHGVSDAANDLREIEAKLGVLEKILEKL